MIAVVGLSRDPSKAAHAVPAALQAAGFRVVPVNPEATELLGERAFATLTDIPFPIDLVLVFRPASFAPAIAEQAGLAYVEDRCAGVERALYGIVKRVPAEQPG